MHCPSRPCLTGLLLAWLAATASAATSPAPSAGLHRPSPDWRDQVIYFVMTDRFADGNPRNNHQGAGEFNPSKGTHYQGGDLQGLAGQLGYIRGLGATGVWLTPPVANQWLDSSAHSAGYHGYWAEDFGKVDPHLGTLADYQALSRQLHARGMVLVQDIVVNHTGDYFWYRPEAWQPSDPLPGYAANLGTPPTSAPRQWPFSLNDPRRAADRQASVYHWTPNVANYGDRQQELNWQMAGLDDLNTENPLVRRALRASYGHWIKTVGVDAYRVDTAFYVPEDFFADFLHAKDPQAPGIERVARQTGRRDFLSFGEGFGIDAAGEDKQSRKIEAYAAPGRMSSMLNFPLYGSLGEVFARGRPTAELASRIATMMQVHRAPHRMPTFVDNHDVDRFLASGDEAGLRQALAAMFTLPGIPVIYYGTEQGFKDQRASMFASGWGSGGRDHFDAQAPLYRFIRSLADLRAGDQHLLSRGAPTVLHADTEGPGALAWRTDHAGRSALVVFNTGPDDTTVRVHTGLRPGTPLQGRWGMAGLPQGLVVDAQGQLALTLPARSTQVWMAQGRRLRHQAVDWRQASASAQVGQVAPWGEWLQVDDPAGDDTGPEGLKGSYRYPSDPSFAAQRSMDLRLLRARTRGGALQLEITLPAISTVWNPPLGFDHLALTVFIELPGQAGGRRVMPLQNSELPGDMRWHRRLRVNGWASTLFSEQGASATAEGTPTGPAAQVQVNREAHTITLTLPAAALGRLPSLSGARLYVNTWDYDAGYRALGPEPQGWAMGGASATAPKVMDDSAIITLP